MPIKSVKIGKSRKIKLGKPVVKPITTAAATLKKTIQQIVEEKPKKGGIFSAAQDKPVTVAAATALPPIDEIINPPPQKIFKKQNPPFTTAPSPKIGGMIAMQGEGPDGLGGGTTTYMAETETPTANYRPEIVALTKFYPLFDDSGNITNDGLLFDALVESLRKSNADLRNVIGDDPTLKAETDRKNEVLSNEIDRLNSKLNELSAFISFFSSLKDSLNIKNKSFNPMSIYSSYIKDSSGFSNGNAVRAYAEILPNSLNLNSVLYRNLSYKDKFKDKNGDFFNSFATRSWVITLEEMKQMIHSHSRLNMNKKIGEDIPLYGLVALGYPNLIVDDRITTQKIIDLGAGIQDFNETVTIELTTSGPSFSSIVAGGPQRFFDLNDMKNRFYNFDNSAPAATVLYVAFKGIRQKLCSLFKNENFDNFDDKINSLIINGYKTGNPFTTRLQHFGGNNLYDIGFYGKLEDRDSQVLMLESANITDEINGSQYLFEDYGSESFFVNMLNKASADYPKLKDAKMTIESIEKSFLDFILNSGTLPINDSIHDLQFSTDPKIFFEDLYNKFVDEKGRFITTKDYVGGAGAKGAGAGKYIGAGNHDLDALMLFGLASGNPSLKGVMGSKDVDLKIKSFQAGSYSTNFAIRTSDHNIAILKNALYTHVINKINGNNLATDQNRAVHEIYNVLSNIADVVGGGLKTNDDNSNVLGGLAITAGLVAGTVLAAGGALAPGALAGGLPASFSDDTYSHFNTDFNEGASESVLLAHDSGDGLSDEEKKYYGPTTTGDPRPRWNPPEDEFVKWGYFSIQTEPADDDPTTSKPPLAWKDIQITLNNSPLIDTIVEIMRPIVQMDISAEFSLAVFDVICSAIGYLAPFKEILVYIDDYEFNDDAVDLLSTDAFAPDNEMKSALVFFTKFYSNPPPGYAHIYKTNFISNIMKETSSLVSLAFSCLNTTSKLLTTISTAESKLSTFKKDIAEYISNYVGKDPKKFALLSNEQQLALIMSTFKDVYDTFDLKSLNENNESFEMHLDSLPYSKKSVNVLRKFFNDSDYTIGKGYNNQIMTVGIPQGLLRDLSNQSIEDAENVKMGSFDIFKILVYKLDLSKNDIVYRPKEFLFETSRFPIRTYSKIADPGETTTISDFENNMFNVFPTRDYTIYSKKEGKEVFKEFLLSTQKSKIRDAFPSEDYANYFSDEQLSSILKNHITSFILENYLNIISGMRFNESSFMLTSDDDVQSIYDDIIVDVIGVNIPKFNVQAFKKAFNQAFNQAGNDSATAGGSVGLAGKVFQAGSVPKKNILQFLAASGKLTEALTSSSLTQAAQVAKEFLGNPLLRKIVQPKKFDRVFNIIFDPDSFIIDRSQGATPTSALNNALSNGTIRKVVSGNVPYYTDNERSFKDPSMFSYFVVIESYK